MAPNPTDRLPRRRVVLAEPRGFCAGVHRAIAMTERALELHGPPVYVRKQIVHNHFIVGMLERKGARFVDEIAEVPRGSVCVLSAHGVSPAVRAEAAAADLHVIDATCPLVAKVHQQAKRATRDGRLLLLIGHDDHEETEGTRGEAPQRTVVVETVEDVDRLDLAPDTPVAYLTQTTLSMDDTADVVARIRARFTDVEEPSSETICYASQNRQTGIKSLARQCELILVVGSENSSNSQRMVDVAGKAGVRGHLVPDVGHLRAEWLRGVRTVGVSSGASAPEVLVDEVLARLAEHGFDQVDVDTTAVETVTFSLPGGRSVEPGRRLLPAIRRPSDLRRLTVAELDGLAAEIRALLVAEVSRTGGHLGPGLGVVELTLALHRVFDSPADRILWDTGHQAYVHKALTGRWSEFGGLRARGGLSGYPSRAESPHDVIENSHASTALSYAYGMATADRLRGVGDRRVVAVVGDGALTGGMAWEALNSIGGDGSRVVIVLNDNGRSYSPTIGGLARHLAGAEPHTFFAALGIGYVGPVDGHDVVAVQRALLQARDADGPVVVHCLTSKGRGHALAENDEVDRFHAVRPMDPATGVPLSSGGRSWTSVFGEELVELGAKRPDIVAVTAAMRDPTGLSAFAARFPDRVLDVGIAEQNAVTAAAGLAMAGMRPVVAIYSTFLNRAFDQVLLDVALHSCPVVLVLDRAGVTGDDGPSHNGMCDLSLLNTVPAMRVAAPRDAATLREALRSALRVTDGPCAVRFPKGTVGPDLPAAFSYAGLDVLRPDPRDDVLLLSVGPMARTCLDAADRLAARGIGVTVVDPGWVRPVNPLLRVMAPRFQVVASVEDNLAAGGFGSALADDLRDAGVRTPVAVFGLPRRFLAHGRRDEVLADCGLTAEAIAADLGRRVAAPERWRAVEPSGSVG
ncbi:1-deoxy-D-xylulose-5-phosphate synthase [Actinokineospora sp. UTMC 2448]|nr:1-deoxy-D-xylulose-5-phosphate synthase [Actinokineospora sp. UTMC 2448]